MRLTTSSLFYGSRQVPFTLPAEWQTFEDGADIDLDALSRALALATNNALTAEAFRHRSKLTHTTAIEVKEAGKHIFGAPRTVVMGSGFTVVWMHGDLVDFVKDIETT